MGKTEIKNWTVLFQRGSRERGDVQKCLFALPDKHLLSTVFLKYILDITGSCNVNTDVAKKCYSDMIRWYIAFLSTLLSVIPKLFKNQKRIQP